jgi:hypothetical protein
MTAAGDRAVRVSVDYSQYWVAAGPDIEPGEEIVPGLLLGLGPQAVAVLTGVQSGRVTVSARAVPEPPAVAGAGWDVVAEADLDCPEGVVSVCDWGGPGHDELGDLAIAGPGRYRVRVHTRNREPAGRRRSAEEHHLLIWPVTQPAPPLLLTEMDACGRLLSGEEPDDAPAMDALDLAAAAAVRGLAELAARPGPPELSGELAAVRAQTVVPATARRVWNLVSAPWGWLGIGGGTDPADFDIYLHREPRLTVAGGFVVCEPVTRLAFTWSWTTTRVAAIEHREPFGARHDLSAVEVASQGSLGWPPDPDRYWMLPPEPTTVDIRLRRQANGAAVVELEHRDLPVELAGLVQPFWDWALRELPGRLSKAPFYGFPWDR